MTRFEQALTLLRDFLGRAGAPGWAERVDEDLARARTGDPSRHLSRYGGMGSLNDLILCERNGHAVTARQEPWARAALDGLRAACARLAAGEPLPSFDEELSRHAGQLTGWRCLACGYGEIPEAAVERLVAVRVVPAQLRAALEGATTGERLGQVDTSDTVEAIRRDVRAAIAAAGIEQAPTSEMRTCPTCGSNDHAVYRWDAGDQITPAENNLPLRSA